MVEKRRQSPERKTESHPVYFAGEHIGASGEGIPLYPGGLQYFDEGALWANLAMVGMALDEAQSSDPAYANFYRHMWYPLGSIDADNAVARIDALRTASPVAPFGITNPEPYTPDSAPNHWERYVDRIRDIPGAHVPIDSNHMGDYFLLRALLERGINLSDTLVFVLDHHFDAGDSSSVDKASWIRHALEHNLVGAVHVLGLHPQASNLILGHKRYPNLIAEQLNDLVDKREIQSTLDSYRGVLAKYPDRLSIDTMYCDNAGVPNNRSIREAIKATLNTHKKKIKRLLVSVDGDVLDTMSGYSATNYSHLAALVRAGMTSIDFKYNSDKTSGTSLIDAISRMLTQECVVDGVRFAEPLALSPGGLSQEMLLHTIRTIAQEGRDYGMSFGIPIGTDSFIAGTISEFAGLDVGGASARAIEDISKALCNATLHSSNSPPAHHRSTIYRGR